MDERTFTVEEVAKKLNVTPRTLHYYEEMGLIAPVSRTAGGHRLYDEQVVQKLNRILQIKASLGISLQEIREIMDGEDAMERLKKNYKGSVNEEERSRILDEYIQLLQSMVSKVDDRIANLNVIRASFAERLLRSQTFREQGSQQD